MYENDFNAVAKQVQEHLAVLGGQSFHNAGLGDEDSGDLEEQFDGWASQVIITQSLQTSEELV